MTNDTLKSLGYLTKSLKMTKRALEKNKAGDSMPDNDYNDMVSAIDEVQTQINAVEYRMKILAVINPPSPTAVNPAPPPSTFDTDGSDDLLTT